MSGGVGPAIHSSANQQPAQPVDSVTSPVSPHTPAFLLLLPQLHSLAPDIRAGWALLPFQPQQLPCGQPKAGIHGALLDQAGLG